MAKMTLKVKVNDINVKLHDIFIAGTWSKHVLGLVPDCSNSSALAI